MYKANYSSGNYLLVLNRTSKLVGHLHKSQTHMRQIFKSFIR